MRSLREKEIKKEEGRRAGKGEGLKKKQGESQISREKGRSEGSGLESLAVRKLRSLNYWEAL